jgi:acyl dehydratase
LTEKLGTQWLASSLVTTRFLKPAYDGELLSIADQHRDAKVITECSNSNGVLLANLECTLEATAPDVDSRAKTGASTSKAERVEINWESVQVDVPLPTYAWKPDHQHNSEYAARLDDVTAIFQEGVLHPHAILSQANQVLVRRYIMPAWIHTGSEIRFRKLLRVGDEVEVRSMPIEKWEKKGHQFIKLYIAYVVGGEVATEIYHTAIFRVAEK